MAALPTIEEMLRHALDELDQSRWHLSETGNWLRSDWSKQPSPAKIRALHEVQRLVGEAKGLIDQAKSAIYDADR